MTLTKIFKEHSVHDDSVYKLNFNLARLLGQWMARRLTKQAESRLKTDAQRWPQHADSNRALNIRCSVIHFSQTFANEKLCPDNYKIKTEQSTVDKVAELSGEFFDEYATFFIYIQT